jgi:hypothetical protein
LWKHLTAEDAEDAEINLWAPVQTSVSSASSAVETHGTVTHQVRPRAKLLQGQAWEAARPSVCRTLGRELSAERELQALTKQLDEAYRHTAATLPSHEDLRIRQINGKDGLSLTPLDKLEEPRSLLKLKGQLDSLLPRVDLPDAILEIHALTALPTRSPTSAKAEGESRILP